MIEAIYTGCLVLGVGYALLSSIGGWFFDHGGDVQVDAGGHLDFAGHPSPLSGTIIATFVTGFGAGGLVAEKVLGWPQLYSMLLATGTGLALAGAAFAILDFIFSRTQAGSEYATSDLEGHVAEVITPIKAGGMGEIAYVVKGQRERAGARASDGQEIAKGTLVVIENVAGSTAWVRPKERNPEEDTP